MTERFDVVVVGARCAGSPLAALLAREGVNVVAVEAATFPRDTLSTHLFQADALAFVDRLGVSDRLRATGAPFIDRVDLRMEDLRFALDWPQRPGDVGGVVSVRRLVLDPILAQAAEDAGAVVRMATTVTGLVTDNGRVVGVRVTHDGHESELRARLVVGADGRNSTVARLCGARRYNVVRNERFSYWAYFEQAKPCSKPTLVFHRWADRWVAACPTDNGLYFVGAAPVLDQLDGWRRDLEGSFLAYIDSCQPVADAVSGARRVGKLVGVLRWRGFFREASGPGWVLVGDAGHFKDPTLGVGIGDAFQQADTLAPAIVAGLTGSPNELDEPIAKWGRSRDAEAAERYWLATDFGKAGTLPAIGLEVVRRLGTRGKVHRFLDITNRRTQPSAVMTVPRSLSATARLLARSDSDRRAVLREFATVAAEDTRRRWRNRHPEYEALNHKRTAGADTTTTLADTPDLDSIPSRSKR